jgi:LuxR family transcriptional regulator, quorum-sensing system regulator BjaR1
MRSALTNTTLDTLDALERAPSVLKVKEVFRNKAAIFGFDAFLCSAPPRPKETPTRPTLFEEWPRAWRQRYAQRRYYVRDPMVQELYRNAEPYLWSDVLARGDYSRADRAIVLDASAWSMREGLVVPLYGVGGQLHAVTMAGASPRTDHEARAEMHLVSIYAYARAKQLAGRSEEPTPVLRPRQREALQWAAAGKSDWEIGQIMRISTSGAHKLIESAKRRIGVATRIQAVVAAIQSGQLQV